jgi:hypothetical protein
VTLGRAAPFDFPADAAMRFPLQCDLGCAHAFSAEPLCRGDGEPDEKRQDDQLCDQEWRFFLRRSQRLQGGNPQEGLHYCEENISDREQGRH